MASCPGRKPPRNLQCLATLWRCRKCGNVGCDQPPMSQCSNQAFRLGVCARCGTLGQKDPFR